MTTAANDPASIVQTQLDACNTRNVDARRAVDYDRESDLRPFRKQQPGAFA